MFASAMMVLAGLVLLTVAPATGQTTCSAQNEHCSCCCYTSINPELMLLAVELNLYACNHPNYGLLPCCNPNADEEPPLPPMINSWEPTHAPTEAPSETTTTLAPETTLAVQGGDNEQEREDESEETTEAPDDKLDGPLGPLGPAGKKGMNGPLGVLGLAGQKGEDLHRKGAKTGKAMWAQAQTAQAYEVGALGLCAAGLLATVMVGAVIVQRRQHNQVKEVSFPLLREHGPAPTYNRTFMGIFGDINQDPTAGSVLMTDPAEPEAKFSPPREQGGRFSESQPFVFGPGSPTNPNVEGAFLRSHRAGGHQRLLPPVEASRKSAMDTLRDLGLTPELHAAAGPKVSKPSWFSSVRGLGKPGLKEPTAKTKLLGSATSTQVAFSNLGLAPVMDNDDDE